MNNNNDDAFSKTYFYYQNKTAVRVNLLHYFNTYAFNINNFFNTGVFVLKLLQW